MRRLMAGAGIAALAMAGAAGMVNGASADQAVCTPVLPFDTTACVTTTNSGGQDGDVHSVIVVGRENVPGLAAGFNPRVDCDDNGGTTDAEISANAGPDESLSVPAQCPELP